MSERNRRLFSRRDFVLGGLAIATGVPIVVLGDRKKDDGLDQVNEDVGPSFFTSSNDRKAVRSIANSNIQPDTENRQIIEAFDDLRVSAQEIMGAEDERQHVLEDNTDYRVGGFMEAVGFVTIAAGIFGPTAIAPIIRNELNYNARADSGANL